MDDRKLRQRIEDGIRAKAVLENEIFKKVAEEYRQELFEAFKDGTDEEALDRRREALVLGRLLYKVAQFAKRGDEAQKDLEVLRAKKEADDARGYVERSAV